MSRPSREESERLEVLEGAAGRIGQALESCSVLALRLRQLGRRVQGVEPRLLEYIELANQQLTVILDDCDDAHEHLGELLELNQQRRTKKNDGLTTSTCE